MLLRKRKVEKYSAEWFHTISDEELYAERETIRIGPYLRGKPGAEALLHRFDLEEIRRLNEKYEKEHPNAKPRHREHGWYLPNDD